MNDDDPESFQTALPSAQVRAGRVSLADLGRERLAFTRVDGRVCAFNSLCPHQLGNLGSGFMHAGAVECPVHGWRFDVCTGLAVYPRGEAIHLRRYQVVEANGLVSIRLRPPLP
jgi:pyruvate oxidase